MVFLHLLNRISFSGHLIPVLGFGCYLALVQHSIYTLSSCKHVIAALSVACLPSPPHILYTTCFMLAKLMQNNVLNVLVKCSCSFVFIECIRAHEAAACVVILSVFMMAKKDTLSDKNINC